MGKLRTRLNLRIGRTNNNDVEKRYDKAPHEYKTPVSFQPVLLQNNPFAGLNLTASCLSNQRLPQRDCIEPYEPRVNQKLKDKIKKLCGKKKEKVKQKRERFIEKLKADKRRAIEEREAVQRANTPVVGDMQLMKMALPTLDDLATKKTELQRRRNPNEEGALKHESRQPRKQSIKDILNYQRILSSQSLHKDHKKLIIENMMQMGL